MHILAGIWNPRDFRDYLDFTEFSGISGSWDWDLKLIFKILELGLGLRNNLENVVIGICFENVRSRNGISDCRPLSGHTRWRHILLVAAL